MEEFRDLYEEFQEALRKENERSVAIVWQYLDRSGEMTEYHEGVIAAFRPWNVPSIRRGNLLAGSSTWRRAV